MNRTIWIFRAIAVLILIVFAVLMSNLYVKLHRLQGEAPRPAATP